MAAKNLKNTILIDTEEFNINAFNAINAEKADRATSAAVADKVEHKLTINIAGQSEPIEFTGEAEKSIDVISPAGGDFDGPITVPNAEENISDNTVLNYSDIKNKVIDQLINTTSLASWNGTELTFTDEAENFNGVRLITGKENDLEAFASENTFAAYLYICSDTNNIYFGVGATFVALSVKTAESAGIITGAYQGSIISKTAGDIANNTANIAANTQSFSIVNDEVRKITEGLTVVPNARNAEYAGQADWASSADKANSATGADNAQKLGGNGASYFQKKITIDSDPPANASENDIWIKI